MATHWKRAAIYAAAALLSSVSSVEGFETPASSSSRGRHPAPLRMADVAVADTVAAGGDVFNPENIR